MSDDHAYGMEGEFIDCNVEVEKRSDEDPQEFLRRFHKEVRKSGILERKKKKQFFTKKSKKRRMDRRKAKENIDNPEGIARK